MTRRGNNPPFIECMKPVSEGASECASAPGEKEGLVAAGREDQTSERAAHILTPPSEAQIPDLLRTAGRLRLGITSITQCLTTSCHIATAGDVLDARTHAAGPANRLWPPRLWRAQGVSTSRHLCSRNKPAGNICPAGARLPSLRHLPRPPPQRCPVWIREGLSVPCPPPPSPATAHVPLCMD